MFSSNKKSVVYFRLSFLFSSLFIGNVAIAEVSDKNKKSKELAKTPSVVVIGYQQDDLLNLNTPVTSGSRLDLSALQTPASMSSLSGDEVRGRNNASIQEAVARSPGVFRFGSPGNGGTTLAARGFVGHGSVMQLYDGTRTYIGMGTLTFPTDTWTVDRIDVLRGPGAVLYGEGATGAVVNVIPKNPFDGNIKTHLRVASGSWHKRQVALDSGGGLADSLSFRLAANHLENDGWKERTQSSGTAFRGALKWQANEDLNFILSQDISVQRPQNDFGTPLIDGYYHKNLRKKNYNVVDDDLLYNDRTTHLNIDWRINENINVHNDLYYITSSRRWLGAEEYTWKPERKDLLISGFYHITHRYEQLGDRQTLTVKHPLLSLNSQTLLGSEYNHIRFKTGNNAPYNDKVNSDYYVNPWNANSHIFDSHSAYAPNLKSETNIFALFAENRTQLAEQWSFVTGLRYDYVAVDRYALRDSTKTDKTTSGFNWRAGLVFSPTDKLSIYGQYSTSTDAVSPLISMPTQQQQFDLSTAKQAEVGIKQQFWDKRGEWTLAIYHIEMDKLLTADPYNPQQRVQIGKQSSKGIEANVDLNLPFDFHLSANASHVKAKYNKFSVKTNDYDGNRPRNVPSNTANFWIKKDFVKVAGVGSGVRYVGSRYADYANTQKIPHYLVVDANMYWQIIPDVKVNLEVNNLFDQHYAITSHNSGNQRLIGEPRSFLLTLDYKF